MGRFEKFFPWEKPRNFFTWKLEGEGQEQTNPAGPAQGAAWKTGKPASIKDGDLDRI